MMVEFTFSSFPLHDHEQSCHHQGSFISDDLSVVSSHGYRIAAPKGLAWCCQDAGVL